MQTWNSVKAQRKCGLRLIKEDFLGGRWSGLKE